MRPLRTALFALGIAGAGLIFGHWGGPWVGAAAVAFLAALWAGGHERRLGMLQRWARAPIDTPAPSAGGAWGEAFAALARRMRQLQAQRQEIARLGMRFRQVLEALPDGVVVLAGEQHAIEWLNPRAAQLLGLDPERDRGLPLTHFLRDPEWAAYLQRARQEASEPYVWRPLGEDKVLALRLAPFLDEGMLVLVEDMTRLARLETMRRDFVANVSHELRTPLAVVLGYLETIRDDLQEGRTQSAEALKGLAVAIEYARRMERLVGDLLTLSTLETEAPPPAEKVDVPALLEAVAAEAKALSNGQHEITTHCAGPRFLIGSERELASAFGNLASNAVRYTPAGGKIALAWRPLPQGGAVFSVADTGIGIEAQHWPRLTERFYRVDVGRSRAAGGTGLGLAIVKHVLERHDARLEIDSTPGKGSVFSLLFPKHRVAQEP
ncbi:MAG: phosphate regulon sensor histidine kinase PhoR [Rhodocyclaceae bacterium]|nr:phosphate regulon sensor histidine kinase PhoR [Rhodocyclaceae bacterium]